MRDHGNHDDVLWRDSRNWSSPQWKNPLASPWGQWILQHGLPRWPHLKHTAMAEVVFLVFRFQTMCVHKHEYAFGNNRLTDKPWHYHPVLLPNHQSMNCTATSKPSTNAPGQIQAVNTSLLPPAEDWMCLGKIAQIMEATNYYQNTLSLGEFISSQLLHVQLQYCCHPTLRGMTAIMCSSVPQPHHPLKLSPYALMCKAHWMLLLPPPYTGWTARHKHKGF